MLDVGARFQKASIPPKRPAAAWPQSAPRFPERPIDPTACIERHLQPQKQMAYPHAARPGPCGYTVNPWPSVPPRFAQIVMFEKRCLRRAAATIGRTRHLRRRLAGEE